jgi:U3 small nucleolar RNA-associated protein 14
LSHLIINLNPVNKQQGAAVPLHETGREKSSNNMNTTTFNAQELCSRKLWQMVNTTSSKNVSDNELRAAIEELATRRRYLEELAEIGKLEEHSRGA